MDARSWDRLTDGAVRRLARCRSERLTRISHGDAGGAWRTIYEIEPEPAFVRAGAVELRRAVWLAGSTARREPIKTASVEVAAGVWAGDASRLIRLGEVARPDLDAALETALDTALALGVFDLTATRDFEGGAA